jgi:hypothetical protein
VVSCQPETVIMEMNAPALVVCGQTRPVLVVLVVLAVLCGCAHHGPQVQSESAGRAEREQLSWDGVGQRADHRAGTWIWGVFWQWR